MSDKSVIEEVVRATGIKRLQILYDLASPEEKSRWEEIAKSILRQEKSTKQPSNTYNMRLALSAIRIGYAKCLYSVVKHGECSCIYCFAHPHNGRRVNLRDCVLCLYGQEHK